VLAFQLRATLCCTGVVPDPLNASETEPFEALLARVNVPEAAPEACGAKVAVNDALCPEASVTGKEMPVIENSVPVILPEEIVTEPLLAVRVAVWVFLEPVVTLPKLMLVGLTASWPAGVVPAEPLKGIETEEFAAFDVTERAPVVVPEDVGL
jgi:hypothetical protein